MDQKTKLNKETVRLQLEILNCKEERFTDKKTFYESLIALYLKKQELIKKFIEKQKKLYIAERNFLVVYP